MTKPLAGIGVLVTRPAGQAENLCSQIAQAGGKAHCFPTIEIHPVTVLPEPFRKGRNFDWLIVTSANAVAFGLPILEKAGDAAIVAVGPATADAAKRAGIRHVRIPDSGASSESVLAMPEFQDVSGKRILILRGRGGRELLSSSLQKRGAAVEYAEVYRREIPATDIAPLLEEWQHGQIDIVTLTSADALRNLHTMLPDTHRRLLHTTPLVVTTPRMITLCQEYGVKTTPIVAENAGDDAIITALRNWRSPKDLTGQETK
ncbi:MAG: uroporphyrinogen-III synthase [Gammaproteobacteria bacterium]|nr:uroporphyrinogen-III synthase [Gammaproteobacteria bacterium]